jgi:dTMP kinase
MAFLVFEGLDGSGKSTLIQSIKAALHARGQEAIVTREPGGTPLAEEIREVLLRTEGEPPVAATELLLYAAGRAQHVANVIQPALKAGAWVLCDRFSASTVSFQCFARAIPRPEVDWLNRFAQQGVAPDLTLLLDLTVEESHRRQIQRRGNTQGDRLERESFEFHENVRRGYLTQAKEDSAHWLVLDAMLDPAQLTAQVLQAFEERQWLKSSKN